MTAAAIIRDVGIIVSENPPHPNMRRIIGREDYNSLRMRRQKHASMIPLHRCAQNGRKVSSTYRFRLVWPGLPQPGEGHLHLFIGVPASAIADGQIIPLDQTDKYVHMGAPPFTTRTLALLPDIQPPQSRAPNTGWHARALRYNGALHE
ncbi:hypothetical protein [Candidatus Roseilinea sp. NK_OTU-006]|uniref:hypothetical protein n=1 Tax=Candidatus Roseilinea sp. NK_OTU-006 TaxID=2704250 RepID=UPI00145FC77C|nr:hypothetical protein [Candidatus Roseilinea sp. NK_OTU-006]